MCNQDDTEIHHEMPTISAQTAHLYDSLEQSSIISFPSPDIHKTSEESFHSYCAYDPPSFLESPSSIWPPYHRILQLFWDFKQSTATHFMHHLQGPQIPP